LERLKKRNIAKKSHSKKKKDFLRPSFPKKIFKKRSKIRIKKEK